MDKVGLLQTSASVVERLIEKKDAELSRALAAIAGSPSVDGYIENRSKYALPIHALKMDLAAMRHTVVIIRREAQER